MAEYLIQGDTLTGIADAIRDKMGISEIISVNDMASKIKNISTKKNFSYINSDVNSSIQDYSFIGMNGLESVQFPNATGVGRYAFKGCPDLIVADFPSANAVSNGAFYECVNLKEINIPNVSSIGKSAFFGCSSLETITISGFEISEYAFNLCTNLETIILTRDISIVSLFNQNALYGTKIYRGYGFIYVPDELVDEYKSDTGYWSVYASQIRPLSEYTSIIT